MGPAGELQERNSWAGLPQRVTAARMRQQPVGKCLEGGRCAVRLQAEAAFKPRLRRRRAIAERRRGISGGLAGWVAGPATAWPQVRRVLRGRQRPRTAGPRNRTDSAGLLRGGCQPDDATWWPQLSGGNSRCKPTLRPKPSDKQLCTLGRADHGVRSQSTRASARAPSPKLPSVRPKTQRHGTRLMVFPWLRVCGISSARPMRNHERDASDRQLH